MAFVSHARNFEDVMLWRALHAAGTGFYIDAGAGDPDLGSATRAFYDRGWSGINIEPSPGAMLRLQSARARDVNLPVAVGRAQGSAVLPSSGLSGPATVELATLAAICREHVAIRADAAIHFLRIDAGGAEADALAGADFGLFRPWVVVVRATGPLAPDPTHHAWEPAILAAGYRFAYFDGVSRFYLATEHAGALSPAFAAPPNAFDDFVRVADTPVALRLAETQGRLLEAEHRAREAVRLAREPTRRARQALATARAAAAADAGEVGRLHRAVVDRTAHFEALIAKLRVENAEARAMTERLLASTSWRVTAPLRRAVSIARARPLPPADPPGRAEPERVVAAPHHDSILAPVAAAPRRAVHQFHSGSAVGDAITNAMLMIRAALRRLGLASEIFVEHLDPALIGELNPLDALPRHDRYVLIQHHSMGFDAFDRIAALPAPKVLMYHNITPPALLDGAPELQRYAELGRQQLARLRPHMRAALADSDYNAIELRRLGFAPVQTCTMLFDVSALRTRAAARSDALRTDAFTILFVGRVLRAKGQDALFAAYQRFARDLGRPSRLVIVGRHGGAHDRFAAALLARISEAGLQDQVILTGFVPDDTLDAWYAAADLYVSLSRHEGFAVPLVEAMAHRVPVLALPSGAVPYTLAGAAELIEDDLPGAVAEQMLALARAAPRRARIVERQRAVLERLSADAQRPALLQALAAAGAMPPEDAQLRASLAANMRYTVTGHASGSYSLAAINRDLAITLDAWRPGRVRLAPVEGAPTAVVTSVPDRQRAAVDRLIARPAPDTGPELVISQHYPVHLPAERGDVCVALFFWEESLVPAETVAQLDRWFDGVLAASRFVAKALLDSGLAIPVRIVGHAPDLAPFLRLHAERARHRPAGPFTFLHVSSGFPRKGIDVLLAAYARAFRAGDAVRLVVKVFPNPHNEAAAMIDRLRANDPGVADIVLMDRDAPSDEVLALYRHADAVVLPTRGEGLNLAAAEAMAAGVPLIVTGYGGHTDFCTADTARLLAYRFQPSSSHLATAHSVWAEPDEDDLVAALRESVGDPGASVRRAQSARRAILALTDGAALAHRLTAAAVDLLLAPPAEVRVAWVSTWQVRCGIAEYSRQLAAAAAAADPALRLVVLSDRRTEPGGQPIPAQPVWDLSAPHTVPQLATALAAEDPAVVVVQHQPGLFSWAGLAELLADVAATRPVVATLHNTRNLLDVDDAERCRTVAALGAAARVLVHTLADLNRLRELGLVDNVALLPHGTPQAAAAPPARPLSPADAPVIGCYGFFLPGKGIGALIEALALLRRDWPYARLRLVNAEYGTDDSTAEVAACRTLAERTGVPVEWHTGFLPNERSLALLGGCDVVALPYQSSQEASSASLRTALSAGAPVAVTPLPLFDEAGGAVARLPGTGPADLAAGLNLVLGDAAMRGALQHAAADWLADRAWERVGRRLAGMLRGLANDPGRIASSTPDTALQDAAATVPA